MADIGQFLMGNYLYLKESIVDISQFFDCKLLA